MIESLTIKNLFLIEDLTLEFERGFTVFTGETGSGKSALLNAIRLILGDKTDASMVRKGCEIGVAVGSFSKFNRELFCSKGIPIEEGESLLIQREIYANGKTKASINHIPVNLSLLRELGKELIEIADQGASLILKDESLHQKYFDIFAGVNHEEAGQIYSELEVLKKKYRDLLTQSDQKEREIANIEQEIKEIEANFLDEEAEKILFEEYTLLTHSKERKDLLEKYFNELPSLKGSHLLLQKLSHIDPSIQIHCNAFYELILELSEINHSLTQSLDKIDLSQEAIEAIEDKLSQNARIKKRFGKDIPAVLDQSRMRLEVLRHLDEEIEEIESEIRKKELLCNALFRQITQLRHSAKRTFEEQIEQELKTLNIPSARFSVEIESVTRTSTGDESIYFLLAPNIGEKLIRVRDQISGGEMARLLLTLLTLLATKEQKPLIVFDEIDANIGGQTALSIGQKFLQLAGSRQVIAITHFPQVAIAANHHFLIDKINQNERTHTTVLKLKSSQIKHELKRMAGLL